MARIAAPAVKTTSWGSTDAIRLAIDHIKALGASVKRVGFEPSFLPSDAKDLLSKELGGASLADSQFVLERLRAVKTAAELDLVRE
ncbi:MAG TPA: aminopeptidase P family N-terminal domain-containing protein, partial [Dongiaceae bacterium]